MYLKEQLKRQMGIETEKEELQEFLSINRITPNPNTNANMSPAELMFAKKIRSLFVKLILSKKGNEKKLISLRRLKGKKLFPKLSFR